MKKAKGRCSSTWNHSREFQRTLILQSLPLIFEKEKKSHDASPEQVTRLLTQQIIAVLEEETKQKPFQRLKPTSRVGT